MRADPRLLPRLNRFIPLRPTPRQAAFLMVSDREALFGGAVGGGKSMALLMSALQYVDRRGYRALVVRKTYPMLAQPGGLIFAAKRLLLPLGVRWSPSEMQFEFPGGATLTFRHFEDQGAEANFQGGEYHLIATGTRPSSWLDHPPDRRSVTSGTKSPGGTYMRPPCSGAP